MSYFPPPAGQFQPEELPRRYARVIGKARGRGLEPGIPKEWTPVLDVHPTALRPDCLTGIAWIQFPDRVREVHRQYLEFWYDPPGCALTDVELGLLRRIAAAEEPVMFKAEARTTPGASPSPTSDTYTGDWYWSRAISPPQVR